MGGVTRTPAAVTARSVRGTETLKTPSFSSRTPFAPVSLSIRAMSSPPPAGTTRATASRAASMETSSFSAPQRVLKAQVEKHTRITRAWPDSDGDRNAGHELQPALEVVRPAHAGAQVERIDGLRAIGPDDAFRARPGQLHQRMERRPRKPDDALAGVPSARGRGRAVGAARVRNPRRAQVGMGDETAAPLEAEGQVHLQPGASAAEPAIGVARGDRSEE